MRIWIAALLTGSGIALAAPSGAQAAYLGVAHLHHHHGYHRHYHHHHHFHHHHYRYSREELTRKPIYAFHVPARCHTIIKRGGMTKKMTKKIKRCD